MAHGATFGALVRVLAANAKATVAVVLVVEDTVLHCLPGLLRWRTRERGKLGSRWLYGIAGELCRIAKEKIRAVKGVGTIVDGACWTP